MTSVKKLIEAKQDRLNRLVSSGKITWKHAQKSLLDYAQFVSRFYGF